MCRPVLQILTRFQTKKCYYPHPFSDLSLLRLGRKHKNYSNLFGIRIFLFLSYSFGIETIKMFIHSRSSPENHTRFQTKMGKVYIRFQTKTSQKPYPMVDVRIAGSHCHAIKNENQKHNVTQYRIASEKALRGQKKQKSKVQ